MEDLTAKLTSTEFSIKPFDYCVPNNTINNKQCTIRWHVDEIKISQTDPQVVDCILEDLRIAYEKDALLIESRGMLHHLGMKLDFTVKGKVSITMFNYIKNILDELPIEMAGVAVMPLKVSTSS